MRKVLTLTIMDHMNFHIDGLTPREVGTIKSKTSLPVKGAFTTAAYRAKIWDGRESFFSDDGFGFLFEIDRVLDIVESFGYDLENDIEFVFERNDDIDLDVPLITDSYMTKFSGFDFRDYQTAAVNAVITERKGVLDIGTNGGKSWICAAISRVYDSRLRSVVIVPNEQLVKQTLADYKKTDLSVAALTSSVATDKRAGVINSHRHIILTTKLYMNCAELFLDAPRVLIYDESHIFGEAMAHIMRLNLAHCPIRVGLSATIPNQKKDPYKRQMIFNHLGGGILTTVKQKVLIDRGISSKLNIHMFKTIHPTIDELSKGKASETGFDWSVEESYMLNNMHRVEAIGEFIKTYDQKNTLILCHAAFGLKLGKYLGWNVIVDETPTDKRTEWFDEFSHRDDVGLIATFGCAGTGLSINRIFREFLIDVGKNETDIIQGIGRGLRLDGEVDAVEVIDISANTKYSVAHRKERIKIYQREQFDFVEEKQQILILGDD